MGSPVLDNSKCGGVGSLARLLKPRTGAGPNLFITVPGVIYLPAPGETAGSPIN